MTVAARVVVVLILGACVAAEPEPVTVALRATAPSRGRTVCVRDVAEVSGGPDALRNTVMALDLADAPGRAGIVVTGRQVSFRLKLAGIPDHLVRVTGSAETRVGLDRAVVPEKDVMAAVHKAVLARLPWTAEDLDIELVQPIAASLSVEGVLEDVRIKAEVRGSRDPLGRCETDVAIYVQGERRLSFPVYLNVRLCQKVGVLLRQVGKNELFDDTNVAFQRRPVENLRNYVTGPLALAGRKSRAQLPAGHILLLSELDEPTPEASPLLVRSGEPVKIIVRLGIVDVIATGEALQDGRAGQLVRVRNIESKAVKVGRVADKSIVEIDP
jgi:flagella basal body P-ring formation protein FlgA